MRRGILVMRPEPGLGETVRAVTGMGFDAVPCPMLHIGQRTPALPHSSAVDAILLTSGQALPSLARAADADAALRQLPLFAVGDATATRARTSGFARCESASGDAADLAALVQARLAAGSSLLLATGSGHGAALADALRRAGYRVRRRVVYAASSARMLPESAQEALQARQIAACLFFSAQTARNFLRVLPVTMRPLLGGVRALAISPAVGAALQAASWRSVEIASRPDASAMLSLLVRFPPDTVTQESPMTYVPDPERYAQHAFRRCGRSGLDLPPISLGLWHNFGGADVYETGRAVVRRAFDRGVTHFDLANNYGPPYGSAEENFGRMLATDLRAHRNELVISSKAGWDMWPGPYGVGGSRKYLISSLDESLQRMGLDYVDIFYSHRLDPSTPLEETMGALDHLVRQGKALYVGVSSYSPEMTRKAAAILRGLGTPLLIHQPSYSMINRWVEDGLLDTLAEIGAGCIAFSPLGQGMLTSKYLGGIPEDARAAKGSSFSRDLLTEDRLGRVRALNEIAQKRGQSLAQMAIAWVLRDPRITSALVGARSVKQLDDSLDALKNLQFSQSELAEIDRHAVESGIDLWRGSATSEAAPA